MTRRKKMKTCSADESAKSVKGNERNSFPSKLSERREGIGGMRRFAGSAYHRAAVMPIQGRWSVERVRSVSLFTVMPPRAGFAGELVCFSRGC